MVDNWVRRCYFPLQAFRFQECLNHFVRARCVIMYIDAVACVGLDVRFKIACWHEWKTRGRCCWDRGDRRDTSCKTVAPAEWQIVRWIMLAGCVVCRMRSRSRRPTSSDDEDWARVGILHRHTIQSQKLTDCNRLFRILAHKQEIRIKKARKGEIILVGANIRVRQVSGRVVQSWHGRWQKSSNVVCQAVHVEEGLQGRGGKVAEVCFESRLYDR